MSVPCMPPTARRRCRPRGISSPAARKVSLWVVPSADIVASDPSAEAELFEPAADKAYRFPTSYELPADVDHM